MVQGLRLGTGPRAILTTVKCPRGWSACVAILRPGLLAPGVLIRRILTGGSPGGLP